jgi:hypothetical protein
LAAWLLGFRGRDVRPGHELAHEGFVRDGAHDHLESRMPATASRFSARPVERSSRTRTSWYLPSGCGIGLKMFGIEGKTLLEDEPDSRTFDYAMISHQIFGEYRRALRVHRRGVLACRSAAACAFYLLRPPCQH